MQEAEQEVVQDVPPKVSPSNLWVILHVLIILSISYSFTSHTLRIIFTSFGICIGIVLWSILNPDKFVVSSSYKHITYLQVACNFHVACVFLCIYEGSELDYYTRICKN